MQSHRQLDHRRCAFCAEPIIEPICLRCGGRNLSQTSEAIAKDSDTFVQLSSTARELIRNVQDASFACGECDREESYEPVFQQSVAAGQALRDYVCRLERTVGAMEKLLLRGGYRLFSPEAQAAIGEFSKVRRA